MKGKLGLAMMLGCVAGAGVGAGLEATTEERFELLDRGGQGHITREEAELLPQLSKHFAAADRNQDGVIDRAEFAAFEEQFGPLEIQVDDGPPQPEAGGSPE